MHETTAPIKTLAEALKKHSLKIATAESCTGGGVAEAITSLSGSSDYFDRGWVVYSNQSKIDLLGVNAHTLEKFGAVSEETAREMAEGALARSQATIAVAVTGIAGPLGGSVEKPVGTVWFAWACKGKETVVKLMQFKGDRTEIRKQAMIDILEKTLALLESN